MTIPNHPLLLAFRGDIVGVVRLDCDSRDVGIIRQLAIDGPAQGVGHGRTLLQMLAARGRTLGLRVLEVNSDGQAVGFYQRFGFDLVASNRRLDDESSHGKSVLLTSDRVVDPRYKRARWNRAYVPNCIESFGFVPKGLIWRCRCYDG